MLLGHLGEVITVTLLCILKDSTQSAQFKSFESLNISWQLCSIFKCETSCQQVQQLDRLLKMTDHLKGVPFNLRFLNGFQY
jgi:hypothetical protein